MPGNSAQGEQLVSRPQPHLGPASCGMTTCPRSPTFTDP